MSSRSRIDRRVTIALDVMGTHLGPAEMIAGALEATRKDTELKCLIVATNEAAEQGDLRRLPIQLVDRLPTQVIQMDDSPATAVRSKRDSTLLRCLEMVRSGEVDGAVTGGNTGAVVLAASAILRRLPHVIQPALATVLDAGPGIQTILVDCGASTERNPAWLEQYALLGAVLARSLLAIDGPTVALLANGTETTKGDPPLREAHRRLAASFPGYVGFVEPDALFGSQADVVVTDGLVGNLVLKTVEAVFRSIATTFPQLRERPARDEEVAQSRDGSKARLSGGAILVGVGGVVAKTHGLGTASGVDGAIRLAAAATRSDVTAHVAQAAAERAATWPSRRGQLSSETPNLLGGRLT